jgi:hypothetical protein
MNLYRLLLLSTGTFTLWLAKGGNIVSKPLCQQVLPLLAVALGLCTTPATASALPILPDQSNDGFIPPLGQNIQFFSPIGQEFTPALTSLDAVELFTNGIGATLVVNIRQDTITGPLLGTSLSVSLQDLFPGITHFDFPATVPLVPGQLYVIEALVASGDFAEIGSSGGPFSTYPGGNQILQGVPQPNNDLWFREGPAAVPEPGSSFVLFGLGALGVGLVGYVARKRGHRRLSLPNRALQQTGAA